MIATALSPRQSAFLSGVGNILDPPIDPMSLDPVGWIGKHTFIWSKQKEICEAVRDHMYVAVRSCHGSGKSFIAAWIAVWWMATHDDAVVVTSAPSANQVKNILWKEIRRAHKKAGLKGKITQGEVPEWKINGEVVAFGRKPADYSDPDEAATRFQGIHAKHVLFILDEGSGIPEWLANAAESQATNEYSRVLIIGNPTNPASYFARVSRPGNDYHKIKVSAWDLPAFTGEYVPPDVAAVLTGVTWVESRRKRWGEGSVMWVAKVEAEFPDVSEDTLFSPAVIELAIQTDRSRFALGERGFNGFDVARLGADECVVYSNKQGYVREIGHWGKKDTMQSVGEYINLYPDNDIPGSYPPVNIDVVGLGSGVYDRLKEQGYPVHPFNGGEKAYNTRKFKNRRAEAYWEAMEAMADGIIDIDELDEDLQAELLETKWDADSTGRKFIEPKDEISKRLGRSPDRADAFIMSLQERNDYSKLIPKMPIKAVTTGSTGQSQEANADELVKDIMEVQL